MRSSKFNRHAEFYALKDMIFNGRAYLKGHHFPKRGITVPRVELLFNQGLIGYEWQISIEAPPVVKEDVETKATVSEKPPAKGEQKKPKKVKKAKTKKAAKKSSAKETDEGDK